jgi:hypothetical protein
MPPVGAVLFLKGVGAITERGGRKNMFEVVAKGEGPLFMDPDADKARQFFRHKNRALVNKVTSVKEAVKQFVRDGEYLGIGGFGANRIPTAVCHEIIRQKKKNMMFAGQPGVFRPTPVVTWKAEGFRVVNGPITVWPFGSKRRPWGFPSFPGAT